MYRANKLHTLNKDVLDKAYSELTPKEQIMVDEAASSLRDMVKERVTNAMLGEGYAREIIGALGRLLNDCSDT